MTPLSTETLETYLAFAQAAAREAGRVAARYFRTELAIESKADASPVTRADRETEQCLRAAIRERFPDHGILGEEFGEERPGAALRWILDPIDGTQPFVRGVPLFTVLVALECEGDAVVGVIHNPVLDETVAAAVGLGCWWNGSPCRVSDVDRLDHAWVNCTNWAALARCRPGGCAQLLSTARAAQTWADAYGYLMVATGRMDAMIDPAMSLWDMAALKPIVEAAGGRLTDFNGVASIYARSAVAANPRLHEAILAMLNA